MKAQILTLAAAVLMAAPVMHAQGTTPAPAHHPRMGPGRHGGPGGDMMAKELGLTSAQQAQMKAIRAKYEPEMKAARDAARPDMEAMRAARMRGDTAAMTTASKKMRADMAPNMKIMKTQMAEMRAVLTPEQQQKMDANRAKMQAWMKSHRGSRSWMGGGRPMPAQPAS